MEWIKELIAAHTDEDGKFDGEAFQEAYKKEFPKHAVPKEEFNSKNEELKNAKETLEKLQKDHKDVEALQQTIADYETQVEELEKEKLEQSKQHQLENALKDAGGTDVDYLKYKLGEVELNKDGSIKDLSNKIKSLQENHPTFFKTEESKEEKGKDGFQVLDNGLEVGNTKPLSKKEIYEKYPNDKPKRIELIKKMEE